MNRIKKLYMAFAVIGGCLFASCDSYLDIQPVGKVIPNTLDEYRSLFITAYNYNMYDRALCEMRTDEVALVADETDMLSYKNIITWSDANTDASTASFGWEYYYKAIYYANAVIDKKDEMAEGSQDDINQLVGEAYLMRAYMHFLLVNLYGMPYTKEGAPETKAVPLKWDLDLEKLPSRATVEKLYEAVLSDIESARGLMNVKEWEIKYRYRFSVLSVDALESRVRLYMGGWQEAYDAAERVLAQKSDLEDFNSEDVNLPNQYQSAEMITAYEQIYSTSTHKVSYVAADFLQKYDAVNDLRPAKFYGSADENGNCPVNKVNGTSQYRCSFRTGELYLNSAEAAARLDKLKEARARLLQLMEKRYTAKGYAQKVTAVNAMNKEALITEILEERARELAFEGHRWFDLRRTTRPAIVRIVDGTTYTLQQDDARYTLGIPRVATDANPGLLN